MTEKVEKAETAAPKKAAGLKQNSIVKVRNKSDGLINTSKGPIKPGETGKATIAELRSLNKFLEKAVDKDKEKEE